MRQQRLYGHTPLRWVLGRVACVREAAHRGVCKRLSLPHFLVDMSC